MPKPSKRNNGAFAGDVSVGRALGMKPDSKESGKAFQQLQQIQRQTGCITSANVEQVAKASRTSTSRQRGVASFYSLLEVQAASESRADCRTTLRVCDGPSCRLRGAALFRGQCQKVANDECQVENSSCIGFCEQAPVLLVDRPGAELQVARAPTTQVFDFQSLEQLHAPTRRFLAGPSGPNRAPRPLTSRFGAVDPCSLDEALAAGAYHALTQALKMNADELIANVTASGLCGRGGAGFNTGQKWRMVAEASAKRRYVICNADESEPGTFKDRMLLENDPHRLLEGMAICARAIGASEGVIYIRGEYADAAKTLERAIQDAESRGFLGSQNQRTDFRFGITVHRGAGAYICGEETALIESLEGKRGEPRQRPPYPTTQGYLGLPTVVNNVETFCNIPAIVMEGAEAYRQLGCHGAAGTKLYCLSGHVAEPGLCEAPLGSPLGQIIHDFGGGMANGSKFKFALTGGAAGTFVPPSLLDMPLHFESWSQGVAVGSGAIIVADQNVNVAEMLLWVLEFFERESCGKCTPCRIGTMQARELVERITCGAAQSGDVDRLLRIAQTLESMSFCGLGQSVAWPIESAIRHFRTDFEQ